MEDHPWDEVLNRYKVPLLITLVGLVLLVGGIFSSGILTKSFKSTKLPPTSTTIATKVIKVDIGGAIKNPGVYTLNSESRMEEAIKMAGGVISTADPNYISKSLNLSQRLSDGMKIYIPFQGDPASPSSLEQGVAGINTTSSGPISINNGSETELDSLPGVGAVTAGKIISNRPYSDLYDLVSKKVMGKATYDKIKELITL